MTGGGGTPAPPGPAAPPVWMPAFAGMTGERAGHDGGEGWRGMTRARGKKKGRPEPPFPKAHAIERVIS